MSSQSKVLQKIQTLQISPEVNCRMVVGRSTVTFVDFLHCSQLMRISQVSRESKNLSLYFLSN